MSNLYLLDCTLRDGGFALEDSVNYEKKIRIFSSDAQKKIKKNLFSSNIDFIEIGAIEQKKEMDKTGFAIYQGIEEISQLILTDSSKEKFAALFRGPDIPIEKIPDWNSSFCKKVRLIIRYSELKKSVDYCAELSKKGYEVFIQPMVTARYTSEELDYLIKSANEMKAYALYFVDSYGYMTFDDVEKFFKLYDSKLDKNIKIGFHAHNNLNTAFSNVQYFLKLASETDREIIADSTCLGMGQGAGNMQTELLAQFLNEKYNKNYDMESILDACESVEEFLHPNLWGYSPMYVIPAQNRVAYKFSVSLRKKYNLKYKEIYRILKNIPEDLRHRYSKENIEKLLKLNGISTEVKE